MTEEIKKHDFKDGLKQELEVIDLKELFQKNPEEVKKPHRASFYQILWFQKGGLVHFVDFDPVPIKPNTVLFLNKNIVQQFDSEAAIEGKLLVFTENFFCKTEQDTRFLKSNLLFNNLVTTSTLSLPNLSCLFSNVFRLMELELAQPKDKYQADVLRNHLKNLLLLSEREARKQGLTVLKRGPDLDFVLQFRDMLDGQFKSEKRVKIYAEQLHLTKKRLNQATARVLGKTPKQIIDERVLLEAKRLLIHTNESIKEIAFELGFNEPTNFVKYFRRHLELTPMEFRDEIVAA